MIDRKERKGRLEWQKRVSYAYPSSWRTSEETYLDWDQLSEELGEGFEDSSPVPGKSILSSGIAPANVALKSVPKSHWEERPISAIPDPDCWVRWKEIYSPQNFSYIRSLEKKAEKEARASFAGIPLISESVLITARYTHGKFHNCVIREFDEELDCDKIIN